jgi:hypothetical protein
VDGAPAVVRDVVRPEPAHWQRPLDGGETTADPADRVPLPKPTWASLKLRTEHNLIFASVGPGPGTIPIKKEPGARWTLVEVLWHPTMIRLFEAGDYKSDADLVLINTDRTKRKFACLADAWDETVARFGGGREEPFDAVLVADDDLEPLDTTWGDILDLFHESRLNVAQPAQSKDAFRAAWPVTVREDDCLYRETTFVEVMCPIFKGRLFPGLLRYFREEPNGWGLEALWPKACAPIGILDGTPIRHLRPIGTAHSMTGHTEDPTRQMVAFRARHLLDIPKGRTLCRYLRDGRAVPVRDPR